MQQHQGLRAPERRKRRGRRGGEGKEGKERERKGRKEEGEGKEKEIKHDGYIQISNGGHVTRYLGNTVTCHLATLYMLVCEEGDQCARPPSQNGT